MRFLPVSCPLRVIPVFPTLRGSRIPERGSAVEHTMGRAGAVAAAGPGPAAPGIRPHDVGDV
ncbi:hypothetical protein GCM10010415_77000 [Streptomyces atrovirens]